MSNENSLEEKEKPQISSLGLEENNEDDDVTEQPRRFLTLPSGHVLAYGGDNGNVSCLVSDKGSEKGPENGSKFVIVQRYDDEVRSIAVSQDGKRLAVGFDTGSTQIYCFDDVSTTASAVHPYAQAIKKFESSQGTVDGNDDLVLSQDFVIDDNSSYFVGPDLGAPIRDMVFLPHDGASSESFPYLLAIASEAGMCVINVTSKEIITDSEHLLEQDAKEFHDQCGVRGLAVGCVEKHGSINVSCSDRNSSSVGDGVDGNSSTSTKMIILASLDMEGRLCLWDATNMKLLKRENDRCVAKKDLGEIHDADAYDRSCRPVIFRPSGESNSSTSLFIGTPGKLTPFLRAVQFTVGGDSTLKISDFGFVKDSAFDSKTEKERMHIQSIVSIYLCSERTMVTSGRDCRVILWEGLNSPSNLSPDHEDNPLLNKQWKVIENFQSESPVTDFCIKRCKENDENVSLLSACANGNLQIFDISRHYKLFSNATTNASSSNIKLSEVPIPTNMNETTSSAMEVKNRSKDSTPTIKHILKKGHVNDDDDDDSTVFSPHEDSTTTSVKNVHFLDEAEEISLHDDEQLKTNRNDDSNSSGIGVGDFDNDSVTSNRSFIEDDVSQHQFISNPTVSRVMNIVQPQPAFSPSSTPLDLQRRFLCWNHIGIVTILQGDDQRNTIDIRFTDSVVRRPISFTDNLNFVIGSVGENGGIFASDIHDDDDIADDMDGLDELNMSESTKQAVRRDQRKRSTGSNNSRPTGSSIFFYRFKSIGNSRNKDWHVILPNGERVLGVACGEGWSAVTTSRRFLRFFSSGGNQNQLTWLKGEPVTMVGRGRFLAIFYHESSPLPNKTQQLGYSLWDAKKMRLISRGPVSCLTKGSSLSWVGFNNDFSLVVMDSDGMLSMLVAIAQCDDVETFIWEWVPVLDTVGLRKSSDDSFWPITVHDGKLVCIPLKGGVTFPDATRRPVTSTLGLRMPLARSIVSKSSALEELSVRSNIALEQKKFVNETELRDNISCDANELLKEHNMLCKEVDKVTIKLFAALVDSGKVDSAFELVGRLHSEKSYEIAMKYAHRHHNTLAEMIAREMDLKFHAEHCDEYDDEGDGHDGSDVEFSKTLMEHDEGIESNQISPDYGRTQKRSIKLHQPTRIKSKKHRVS